jgi:ubiquinone/menaquinone biosynthesis C-methylase UbiE
MSQFSKHTQWQADIYDQNAPLCPFDDLLREIGYSKVQRPKDLQTKKYLEKLNVTNQTKVLDLGCASGILLQRISKTFGAAGTGIDVSSVLLEIAKQKDSTNTYLLADAASLPFPDNSFDLVTSFDNLEHIQEYDKVLQEIIRVLKPDGKLLMNTINKHNRFTFDWLLEKFGSDYHLTRAGHIKELFFDPKDIQKRLNNYGLQNTEVLLFDATGILIIDCMLYIFLIIVEKLVKHTKLYKPVGLISLSITDIISKLLLPILLQTDKIFTTFGHSNAFFIIGTKKK